MCRHNYLLGLSHRNLTPPSVVRLKRCVIIIAWSDASFRVASFLWWTFFIFLGKVEEMAHHSPHYILKRQKALSTSRTRWKVDKKGPTEIQIALFRPPLSKYVIWSRPEKGMSSNARLLQEEVWISTGIFFGIIVLWQLNFVQKNRKWMCAFFFVKSRCSRNVTKNLANYMVPQ